jgi:two-component system CheB/CheR fusion protein
MAPKRSAAGGATRDATIFIVDDDAALSEALGSLLATEGWAVESYAGAEQFLAAYSRDRVGCLVVDARLPGMGGLALLEQLKAEGTTLASIMITGHGDVPTAVRAMEAGAAGFIEKPVAPDRLLGAIERALEEGRDLAEITARRQAAALRIGALTARERQVMDMVVAGNANKEIAYQLGINQRTVENHRATLMKKTGTGSLAELIHLEFAARRSEPRDLPAV